MIKKAIPLFSVAQKKLDGVNSVVQENVTGARVVKAYTREEHEIGRFDTANSDYMAVNYKATVIMSAVFPVMSFIMNLSVVAIIYIGRMAC